jgi:hypothetical protein
VSDKFAVARAHADTALKLYREYVRDLASEAGSLRILSQETKISYSTIVCALNRGGIEAMQKLCQRLRERKGAACGKTKKEACDDDKFGCVLHVSKDM